MKFPRTWVPTKTIIITAALYGPLLGPGTFTGGSALAEATDIGAGEICIALMFECDLKPGRDLLPHFRHQALIWTPEAQTPFLNKAAKSVQHGGAAVCIPGGPGFPFGGSFSSDLSGSSSHVRVEVKFFDDCSATGVVYAPEETGLACVVQTEKKQA
eukprot:TRINITY_DN15432_c0_g1_i2.p1 TRINITY_DN15432_c0_g1~~TRINITY_DN15432_c0_g1_i2.p1  ORF type:complete len:157 (+),score=11.62 TRINITY_DN15432_c0_g1_i2:241-711(+)